MSWLNSFVKWLRRSLGFKSDRPTLKIIEEYHSDGLSVLRIDDDTIPGCCEFWRLDRHKERVKFFVCILAIAQLRQDIALMGGLSQSKGAGLVGQIREQMREQNQILATHYWITGWSRTVSSIDKRGRPYQSERTSDLEVLACDLQGAADVFAGDRYAKLFARRIVKQLAANEFREFERYRTWQGAVKAIDWLQWLTGLAQSKHGISPDHVLQPKKGDRAKMNRVRRSSF